MRTKYEKLIQRFRHMMVDSGALPYDITNAQLLEKIKGETHEEKMHSMEQMLSIVPEEYWLAQRL
jgi:hypothetical protein